jgi:hypothetical protein
MLRLYCHASSHPAECHLGMAQQSSSLVLLDSRHLDDSENNEELSR